MAMQPLPVAVTTTFTPPASCTTDLYEFTTSHPGITSQYKYFQIGPPRPTSCFPPGGPEPWAALEIPPDAYYSPAICPLGYHSCEVSEATFTSSLTETRAICCPQDFSCQTQTDKNWYRNHKCTRDVKNGSSRMFTGYHSEHGATASAPLRYRNYGVVAYGMSIRWMNTDFASPTMTSGATPPEQTDPAAADSSSSSGLSSGAKAGIGVGVAIGAILLILVAWLGYRVYKNKEEKKQGAAGRRAELPEYQEGVYGAKPRNDSQKPTELYSSERGADKAELASDVKYEMGSDERHDLGSSTGQGRNPKTKQGAESNIRHELE
ncbi:hypothetical protein AJ79_04065 [Helicocarpus griseus UAMH5409]|uniref:Uncharacterized protein n=1 Tax=Helicocarpus griseus UAMH5409 TaxID=1447875 RepID=A0A2B7XUT2_9EURO|nr:hypothetical protein AJ79_04065 [Helicocarpus griseus UAMH5409]